MNTFAPDGEKDFALFAQQQTSERNRDRFAYLRWLTDHLAGGGRVLELYNVKGGGHPSGIDNAVAWSTTSSQRWLGGRPLANARLVFAATSRDRNPALLAAKLIRRSEAYGTILAFFQ